MEITLNKIIERSRLKFVGILRIKGIDWLVYPSYWHTFIEIERCNKDKCNAEMYLTARPNSGAGIGHQMANWIAGFHYAGKFGCKYAYMPFTKHYKKDDISEWDNILNFSMGEICLSDLKKKRFKVRRLPKFNEHKQEDISRISRIINSYKCNNVVFMLEQDQAFDDQFMAAEALRAKFLEQEYDLRKRLLYSTKAIIIAMHIRRGDIMPNRKIYNDKLAKRWNNNEYFINALNSALRYLVNKANDSRNIEIYIFSQGKEEDFEMFKSERNVHLCLDVSAIDCFVNMVFADVLIISKSSFSYNPALLSDGIRFVPPNFWHGYPNSEQWIVLNEDGTLE